MTREEAIFCEKSYIGETHCTDCKYYGPDTCKARESHKMAIIALEQDTVSKESYDHEYFLRKELEVKIDELQRQLEEQEQSRDMKEIEEVINCNADAETKCKMISNILTAKLHYFEEPFINKSCISTGVCEHDKQKALDKIRVEIEQRPYGIDNDSMINDMKLQGMKYERTAILEILDKYRSESEE